MPLIYIIVLALVQGVTEFLPISSSAHLIFVDQLFAGSGMAVAAHTPQEELAMHIAVHIGTLAAVLVYFRGDVLAMIVGALRGLGGNRGPGARLAWQIVVATLPVVVVGFLYKDLITLSLRTVELIGWTTLLFGVVLYVADRLGGTRRDVPDMTMLHALLIGASQILALVPGVSRSGITMTMGRALGYDRRESARFSLLLSIPAIAGAGVLGVKDLYETGNATLTMGAVIAALLAFSTALMAIALMMRWLRMASFTPFVVYRVLLGVAILIAVYGFGWH